MKYFVLFKVLSISWQIIRGVTKKSLSAPVLNPILISVWSKGMNSPSEVCFDRTNFARILHWTINEFRRLPTLNITTQFGFWSTSTRWRQNTIQLWTHRRAPCSPENTEQSGGHHLPEHEAIFSISLSNDSIIREYQCISSIFRFRNFDKNTTDHKCIN